MRVRALVQGYGSIGQRHREVLDMMGHEVAVLSARPVAVQPIFNDVPAALDWKPDYIVVASRTCDHHRDLSALASAGFTGKVLVEKPLYDSARPHTTWPFQLFVAYQLRFHPVIEELRRRLAGEHVLTCHAYVGQHLDGWRPGRDTKASYSARSDQGGGALRDLSHELDLLAYLFGEITSQHSSVCRVGDVTFDADDACGFVLTTTRCPLVTLQMNMLDRHPSRHWRIVTRQHTFEADLVGSTLTLDGVCHRFPTARNDSYRAMHEAVLAGRGEPCTYVQGLHIMTIIQDATA